MAANDKFEDYFLAVSQKSLAAAAKSNLEHFFLPQSKLRFER